MSKPFGVANNPGFRVGAFEKSSWARRPRAVRW